MNFKINISSDQDSYKSGTKANITVKIDSSGKLNNVKIRVYGIKPVGFHVSRYKLDDTEILNLTPGINVKSTIYNLPECISCSGVRAGAHEIRAELTYTDTILYNSTKTIELIK